MAIYLIVHDERTAYVFADSDHDGRIAAWESPYAELEASQGEGAAGAGQAALEQGAGQAPAAATQPAATEAPAGAAEANQAAMAQTADGGAAVVGREAMELSEGTGEDWCSGFLHRLVRRSGLVQMTDRGPSGTLYITADILNKRFTVPMTVHFDEGIDVTQAMLPGKVTNQSALIGRGYFLGSSQPSLLGVVLFDCDADCVYGEPGDDAIGVDLNADGWINSNGIYTELISPGIAMRRPDRRFVVSYLDPTTRALQLFPVNLADERIIALRELARAAERALQPEAQPQVRQVGPAARPAGAR